MATTKKVLVVLAIALGLALLVPGLALAGGSQIPHGGYSTTTDACLQCHDVHESAGDYVLLRWSTVRDTCGSCHFLYQTTPPLNAVSGAARSPANPLIGVYNASPDAGIVPAYNPGYSGNETDPAGYLPGMGNSIGSRTSAFEVPWSARDTAPGHNLQRGIGPWLYNDGDTSKTGNYIPGGSKTLTAIERGGYPNTVDTLSFAATNGLYCASCHTPHGNFGKQLTDASGTVVSSKLLSGRPNHRTADLNISNWPGEGGKWCLSCHDKRAPEAVIAGVTYHNHPDQYCLDCHGNYVGANIGAQPYTTLLTDFPHTGNAYNILRDEPDALCLICHKAGTLP